MDLGLSGASDITTQVSPLLGVRHVVASGDQTSRIRALEQLMADKQAEFSIESSALEAETASLEGCLQAMSSAVASLKATAASFG